MLPWPRRGAWLGAVLRRTGRRPRRRGRRRPERFRDIPEPRSGAAPEKGLGPCRGSRSVRSRAHTRDREHRRMSGPVLWMDEVARADVRVVGNKASQLAKLASRGHAVPPFVVITTDLFAAIRADPRVRDLERRLAGDGADEAPSLELRTFIERVEMGAEAWPLIRDARRALGSTIVAVRSSGVAEDDTTTSLAGQLETVLDVRDDEEL